MGYKAALNHSDSCAQVQVAGQYPGNIANILSTNTVCNSIVHVVDQVRGFSTMKSISTTYCLPHSAAISCLVNTMQRFRQYFVI